jgi:CheY-like chemotaxis protein
MEQVNLKKKVLIVEDEPNTRLLLHFILGDIFQVSEAEDGIQAVEFTRTQKPDAILMDIMMPKMDGLTACRLIKNDPATQSIPIIICTGMGVELGSKLSQQMGALTYITKPFSPQDLLDKITQILAVTNCSLP